MLGQKKRPQKVKKEEIKKNKQSDHSFIIKEAVLERLGKPTNLWKIDVIHLWDNRYRVNMWCEKKGRIGSTYRITDSFFVITSPEGGIVESRPQIVKRYNGEKEAIMSMGETVADLMKP